MLDPARPVLGGDDLVEEGGPAVELLGRVPRDAEARGRHVGEGLVGPAPVLPVVGELGDGAVALLGFAQAGLGGDPALPREEERADQDGLADQHGEGQQERPPVLSPQVRLAEEHDAALRQTRLGDAPPPQLAPVEHGLAGELLDRGDRPSGLPPQDPGGETGRALGERAVADEVAAHDPLAEERLRRPEDRHRRGARDQPEDVARDLGPPLGIGPVAGEDHHAVPGQPRQAVELILEGEPPHGDDLDPRGVRLGEPADERFARLVDRGRPADDHHAPGFGRKVERHAHGPLLAHLQEDAGHVRGGPQRLDRRSRHVGEHERSPGEDRPAILQTEANGLDAHGDDDPDRQPRVLPAQELDKLAHVRFVTRVREVEVLDVEVDRALVAPLDLPAEGLVHRNHGRRRRPLGEQKDHGGQHGTRF